jgi:hypothetical protein
MLLLLLLPGWPGATGSRDLEALVNFANEAAAELLTETTE